MILGVTGSIGSGKTTVTEALYELAGAHVVDADNIVHYMLQDGPIHEWLVEKYGERILIGDFDIVDRRKLGRILFGDDKELHGYNDFCQPIIRKEIEEHLEKAKAKHSFIVLSVPLMYEYGYEKLCDKILVVALDEELRKERLAIRSKLTASDVDRCLLFQMPQSEKIERADFVIWNNADASALKEEVSRFLTKLEKHDDKQSVHGGTPSS